MGLSANTFYRRVREYEVNQWSAEPSIAHEFYENIVEIVDV